MSILTVALAIAVGLLAPGPAAASRAAHTRSAAHPSSARQSCAPKHHGESPAHGRSSAKCGRKRTTKDGHQPAHHSPASSSTGGGGGFGTGAGAGAGDGTSGEAPESELPSPEVTGATTGAKPGEPSGEASGEPGGGGSEGSGGVEGGGSPEGGGGSSAEQGSGSTEHGGGSAQQSEGEGSGGTLTDPIDSKYLTETPFGTTSFWIQPWRAYMDTWPASRLLESLGINFNVSAPQAEATAQLLQDSGFKLARIAINWDALSYGDPTQFADEAGVRTRLEALHKHGLRPLILLDANSEGPTPARQVDLETIAEAPAGAQTVALTPASAAVVVPGKTGFDGLAFGGDPDILIDSVAGEHATLSKPLPAALPAGAHKGATLLYAPFTEPILANGEPNPAFQETLAGWLSYVATVCKEAASIFGPEGYDLEVWNELSFGSQFLNAEYYDTPAGTEGVSAATKEITKALLDETVAYVRNPTNGIGTGVGISDGFASQTPFPSGANAPLGLTALSKHLYNGAKTFPAADQERSLIPLNALGERDTLKDSFAPLFVPHYQSLFPEYYLAATQTETIVRDLAPMTTEVYGLPHGRNVGPPGGAPLQKWMTEYNLSLNGATVVGPDESTPAQTSLTPADKAHFQAKALLRSLVAMINKGMTREYFYAAAGHALALIPPSFYAALQTHPETYPGAALGGETMGGLRNMLAQFQGPGPGTDLRQLSLLSITQDGNHAQFTGDGTTAHPSLYDREVLAVLPFQSSPTRFVIPVYVMTRNLLTLYEPDAPTSDIHRFDLPNETFHITLGNLPETATPPTISAYDPLRNETTPAKLVAQAGHTATIEIAATDYPRILTIEYPSGSGPS